MVLSQSSDQASKRFGTFLGIFDPKWKTSEFKPPLYQQAHHYWAIFLWHEAKAWIGKTPLGPMHWGSWERKVEEKRSFHHHARASNQLLKDNSTGTLFICPTKSYFFDGLQIFLHAGCDFLHPEELAPHAKKHAFGYWNLQIWSRILHNWHFWKFLYKYLKIILAKAA